MGEPFEKTMNIVDNMLKPGIELYKVSDEEFAHLQVSTLDSFVKRYEDVAEAMADENRMVALYEFGLTPQLFYAFDCAPLCLETYPMFYSRADMQGTHEFIDKAEEAGVPSEVCSTDRFLAGATLLGEMPTNSFFATASAPCDGTRLIYPLMQKLMEIPTCYIESPYTFDNEAYRWYGKQIKEQLIPFLEKTTRKKFDLDRFREVVETSNEAYELLVEINDMYAQKPSPHNSILRSVPYMNFVTSAGNPEINESMKVFHDDLADRVRKGDIRGQFQEKHRVLWAHVPPTFDDAIWPWMEEEFGATMVVHSLSSTPIFRPIDTTDLDTMLEGYARQGLDLTMSLMRFTTDKFIDFTLKAYHQYQCDCIFLTQHVGCNNICGTSTMLREHLRDNDIPALFIEFDYNDSRILPTEMLKKQIEEFFNTIME
ncbi:MAG: 2-hydroxyacyl-CoA dehydratase [Proteobacteria bacterium]|nr:2-hydroxyacyl-CoA dehydratase [Pseudomonadota bacterium]